LFHLEFLKGDFSLPALPKNAQVLRPLLTLSHQGLESKESQQALGMV